MNAKFRRMLLLCVICLFLLAGLAACSSSRTVNVSEGSAEQTYVMTLTKDTAKTGEVTFDVTNNAQSEDHEFVIVKTDLAADSLPLDADGNVDEDQITVVDEAEDIHPGEEKTVTVDLPPGHYALICNLPEHYGQGMHADFTVTE